MPKLLIILTTLLYLACPTLAQRLHATDPEPGYKVLVYPEEIYFGDPVYIGIYMKNISQEVVTYNTYTCSDYPGWLSLFSESIPTPYHLLREYLEYYARSDTAYIYHTFQPGESKLVAVTYRELPALEDMNFPFWTEAKKRLKAGENIVAYIGLERPYQQTRWSYREPDYEYVSNPILIKPRPGDEMKLLERWLEETPERLRPVPFDQMIAESNYLDEIHNLVDEFDAISLTPKPGFVSKERYLKINRNNHFHFASKERFIKIQGQDFLPYRFLRCGNRKPGDPVCPETWQGWKELEDSLKPSTMRDEIRRTRILIQYCDTNDKKLLGELKEWFANMNELQRWSMSKSILSNTSEFRFKNDILESLFLDLYRIVYEYDDTSKTEKGIEWLKQLERLE